MGCLRKQLGLKDFSPKKSGRLALRQIKERGAFYDWSWWYPSGNRPLQQYLGFTAGTLVMVSSGIRLTAWLQNSKKPGGTVRDWCMSRVCSALALVICIIVCLSWAVNHYRDNAVPTKPARQKCQGNWSWRTRRCGRCVSVVFMRSDAKYTEELADAKAENDALRDDVAALVVVSFASKQSVSQCVKPPPPPAWIMQPPPTGRHRWTGLFHPQRRLITMQKTTGRNPEVY